MAHGRPETQTVADEIADRVHERQTQLEHADTLSPADWESRLDNRVRRLSRGSTPEDRETLIDLGAIVIEAIEAVDRKAARK